MLYEQLENSLQIVVSIAPNLDLEYVKNFGRNLSIPVRYAENFAHNIMRCSDLLIVASGTATLEAALFVTPMIVVYKVNWLSYEIGKRLIKISNIGLVNVVAGSRVVPEFIQHEVTAGKIAPQAYQILANEKIREKMRGELRKVKKRLGHKGASERVAKMALEMIE